MLPDPGSGGPSEPPARHRSSIMHSAMHVLRARLCRLLGISPDGRATVVAGLLDRHGRDAAAYWLQLVLSIGIATFGLIADSTGIVIGAMLVSPLMEPIIDLGMGLATGSALLTLRAAIRFATSVVIVIALSAVFQSIVPFAIITPEIAARTTPTLLDLFVAVACALAGAFAAIRQGLETTSTAAGVAIGIALVPPACVVGIGLAMGDTHVAGGAALLFTANFVAIISVSALLFFLLGFDEVDTRTLETQALQPGKRISRVVVFIWKILGTRSGLVLRVLLPLAFLGATAMPLSEALGSVAWQVRTRVSVEAILAKETATLPTVRTQLVVERGKVVVRLVVLGSSSVAAALREAIQAGLAPDVRAVTTLEIVAVPDANALAAVAARVPEVTARPEPVPPPPPIIAVAGEEVAQALAQGWPREAGALTDWTMSWHGASGLMVTVTHDGAPLGIARELIERALASRLGVSVRLVAASPPPAARAERADGASWVPALLAALEFARQHAGWSACVTFPEPPPIVPEASPSPEVEVERDEGADAGANPQADEVQGPEVEVEVLPDAVAAPAPVEPRDVWLRELVAPLVAQAGPVAQARVAGQRWVVHVMRGPCDIARDP